MCERALPISMPMGLGAGARHRLTMIGVEAHAVDPRG